MGIRITKQIGYYLPQKLVKSILVKNYEEILENLDYNEEFNSKNFKEKIKTLIEEYSKTEHFDNSKINSHMLQYAISENSEQPYDWSAINLVSQIFDYDTKKGFLFKTPELLKNHRHDDLIDYYENESYQFSLKPLNQPIYPISGYIYTGNTSLPKIEKYLNDYFNNSNKDNQNKPKELTKGVIIDNQLMSAAMYIHIGKAPSKPQAYKKEIMKTGSFHPDVDPLVFIIAKASGILQDHVDEYTFRTTVFPAIVTTWG